MSATNFVFSIVNLVIVDKFGRRRILLVTIAGMSICLVIAAVAFHFIPIDLRTLEVQSDEIGWPGYLLIVIIIIFVGLFSSGVATIAWIGTEYVTPFTAQQAGKTDMIMQIHSYGGPRNWHNAKHSNVLVHQHHYCLHLLVHDEGHYTQWRLRLLCGYLFRRMGLCAVLLP